MDSQSASMSHHQSVCQADSIQNRDIANSIVLAGWYLILATIHGSMTSWEPDETLCFWMIVLISAELLFMAVFYTVAYEAFLAWERRAHQKSSLSSRLSSFYASRFACSIVAALLAVEAAVLTGRYMTPSSDANMGFVVVTYYAFVFSWLGFCLEMVFAPVAGAVDWAVARLKNEPPMTGEHTAEAKKK